MLIPCLGQTQTRGDANFDLIDGSADGGASFLDRERAALGDDANQFASAQDNIATVEDADDDLLGGGGGDYQANMGGEEMSGFESSFPAIDTSNEVRMAFPPKGNLLLRHEN